jgi:hypothetical protein
VALVGDSFPQLVERGDEGLDSFALERRDDVVVVDSGDVELLEEVPCVLRV